MRGLSILATLTLPVDLSPRISVGLAFLIFSPFTGEKGGEVLFQQSACFPGWSNETSGWVCHQWGMWPALLRASYFLLLIAWPKKKKKKQSPIFPGSNFFLSLLKDSRWWWPLFASVAPRRVSIVLQDFCEFYTVSYTTSFSLGKQKNQLYQLDSGKEEVPL